MPAVKDFPLPTSDGSLGGAKGPELVDWKHSPTGKGGGGHRTHKQEAESRMPRLIFQVPSRCGHGDIISALAGLLTDDFFVFLGLRTQAKLIVPFLRQPHIFSFCSGVRLKL